MEPANPSRPKYHAARSSTSSIAGSSWGGYGGRPGSPTRSVTTTASFPGFTDQPHLLISRADLRKSIAAIEELVQQAKLYRQSILAASKATSAFASALEACSRIKGCDTASDGLQAIGGLKHMIGAHQQLVGETFYRKFEIPLLEKLDEYRAAVTDRRVQYDKACQLKSAEIRKTESDNIRHGRKKKRDLTQFRAALSALQQQVDDLDNLKGNYHQEVMEAEDELWKSVLDKTVFIVRAQMDVYEKIASKSTDSSLENLLNSVPDPFETYGPPRDDGQIMSVLAPLGYLSGGVQSPKPGLSRNMSSFGGAKLTEEDEDDNDAETTRLHPAKEEAEDVDEVVKDNELHCGEALPLKELLATDSKDPVANGDDVHAFVIPSQEGDKECGRERGDADPAEAPSEANGSAVPKDLGFSLPTGLESRQPWERALWRKQEGYDDDYVPESFLAVERVRAATSTRGHSIRSLSKGQIRPQATFLTFVILFVIVFRALLDGWIIAPQLITLNAIIFAALLLISKVRSRRKTTPSARSPFTQTGLDRPDRAVSWLLPPFILYIISPLVLSLTKATTSDSIWPLAGSLFLLSSILGGFGSTDSTISSSDAGRQDAIDVQNTRIELTLVDKTKSLQSCLSLTFTLSACIVLGSRLEDGQQIFALLSFVGLAIVVLTR